MPRDTSRLLETLFEPSEERLWMTIALMLGATLLLLFVSFSQPWYNADYFPTENTEVDSDFYLDEARAQLYSNGQPGRSGAQVYGSGHFANMMSTTTFFLQVGVGFTIVFALALVAYYHGYIEQIGWIIGAWAGGLGFIAVGLAYFSRNVAENAVAEVRDAAIRYGQYIGEPEPMFWGTQRLVNAQLRTHPGPGWLLALLALVTLTLSLVLLFHFPDDVEGDAAEDYELDPVADVGHGQRAGS